MGVCLQSGLWMSMGLYREYQPVRRCRIWRADSSTRHSKPLNIWRVAALCLLIRQQSISRSIGSIGPLATHGVIVAGERRLPYGASIDSVEERVSKQERYDKLIESERDRQAGLSALEREGDFVRTEAARVAKPQGLRLAAFAFAYLTVVGVVVPIVGLAWRPVPSSLLSRRVLVSLFASGLLALGWYLIWAIRQLSKPSKLQGGDEHTQARAS